MSKQDHPMTNNQDLKVVLKEKVLSGSVHGNVQRVAMVYILGREYRVSAPPEAKGDALEWLPHFYVSVPDSFGEMEIPGSSEIGGPVLNAVIQELKKQKRDAGRSLGMHSDGIHYEAQICLNGHVLHCDGRLPLSPGAHCIKCGAACIDACPHCGELIRGVEKFRAVDYTRPLYCHGCGKPYPWMADRLQTAKELLYHDEKLTMDERTTLFPLLQYVMSNPLNELVPAKKKLIEIKLEKAAPYVRELILDLIAKIAVESAKG